MLRLREITRISRKKICYCGKQLVGDFCADHGSDIRVNSFFVEANFAITSINGELQLPLQVRVKLPENQFLRLFRSRRGFTKSGEVDRLRSCYEITVSNAAIPLDGLVKEFYDEIEVYPFFDHHRIRSCQIRKSGVIIHYLCTHRIFSNTIKFYFSMLPLRRIADYISWRLKHTRATRIDIIHSLKTTRATVYLSDGSMYRISGVLWDQDEKLPLIEISNDQNTLTVPSSKLLQDQNNFFIGQKTEIDALSGLENAAYRLMEAFTSYLRFSGAGGTFKRLKQDKNLFEGEFVGKPVILNAWFLKQVSNDQNRELVQKDLLSAFKSSISGHSRNHKLLIVACSATKDERDQQLPSILRYAGMTYFLIKALLLHQRWPAVDLLIVSAKHGLLQPLDPIAYYDQRLTEDTLEKTEQKIREQVTAYDFKHYNEFFLNLPDKHYSECFLPVKAQLSENCLITSVTGLQHERNSKMMQWLEKQKLDELVL